MEKLKEFRNKIEAKFRKLYAEKPARIWIAAVILTGLSVLFIDQSDADPNEKPILAKEQLEAVDTFIPAGFVLVPIDVINYESLDSVLGRFGVVDLFAADSANGGQSRQVAARIKILRAPRNPSQFAVLAPETEAPALVKHIGGFYVVVQNPNSNGTSFETTAPSKKRKSRLKVEMSDE